MKLLIIICAHELNKEWCTHIKILNDYMTDQNIKPDYCCISN